ncbi:MAG: PilZ domain-containing protein [Candidatus Acidiferrales bacterium]|jgi:hypothetical protein
MSRALRNKNGRTEGSQIQERRGSARYAFAGAASVVDAESNARVIARASDISVGGCYIDAIACFPAGSAVWLRLTRGKQSFTTKGTVIWTRGGLGMSLAFTSTEPEQLWIVTKWIDELRQEMSDQEQPNDPPKEATIDDAFDQEPAEVLKYLILMLVQKSVIDEREGAALLQKLLS